MYQDCLCINNQRNLRCCNKKKYITINNDIPLLKDIKYDDKDVYQNWSKDSYFLLTLIKLNSTDSGISSGVKNVIGNTAERYVK